MRIAEITCHYRNHMGDDLMVVNAARQSFGATHTELTSADEHLILFLARGYRSGEWDALAQEAVNNDWDHEAMKSLILGAMRRPQHWVPFAHPQIQLHLKMPIFLARQYVKHEVGRAWSELSRRYKSDNLEFWFPRGWHNRPEDIKQGSGELIQLQESAFTQAHGTSAHAEFIYRNMLHTGVAPEEARIILPQNLMTTVLITGSLAFWARVYNQRVDSHAQRAAQELATLIGDFIRPLFPVSWKALTGERHD